MTGEVRACDAPTCSNALPKGRRRFCSDECGKWGGRAPHTCEAPSCSAVVPIGRRRFCSDLCSVRGRRVERVVETGDFGRGAIRMIRAMARRVGANDIAEFGLMWQIMGEAEAAAYEAIGKLRAAGFSWPDIAAEVGVSRQAVAQWYARRTPEAEGNDSLRVVGR
jgi:predicted nucleic acid-binding Zn ribbon protein